MVKRKENDHDKNIHNNLDEVEEDPQSIEEIEGEPKNNGTNHLNRCPYIPTVDSDPGDVFRVVESPDIRRHRVEWIYPDGYSGPRHDDDVDSDSENQRNEDQEDNSIDYVVDPNHVEVTLSVEGQVVPTKLCFLKIFSFVICDDNFSFFLNPKVLQFIIVVSLVAGVSVASMLVKKGFSITENQNTNNISSAQHNELIFEKMENIDPRITNISQAILEINGNATLLDGNSSQDKALNWLLYDDEMALAHNSSNLLQRYSIMVFFFDLSGENWFEKDGYGSGEHECEWYGITCNTIDGFEQIQSLELWKNGLKGQIPNEIEFLPRLVEMKLTGNAVSGSIPSSIGKLEKLRRLFLDFNRLTGTIPTEITNCRNIERIHLNNNMLSGSNLDFIGNLRTPRKILLQNNVLSGTIPTKIGLLKSLSAIDLSSNRLTGTIPTELVNTIGLTEFHVANNNLTGEIPSNLGLLSYLKRLQLSYNLLSGMIPTNLYHHHSITDLLLDDNMLTGTIPNLSNILPKADGIYLSSNFINGTIPANLGKIKNLRRLRLHFTMLTGAVPQSLCDSQLQFLTANCAGENPVVSCSCCTRCL